MRSHANPSNSLHPRRFPTFVTVEEAAQNPELVFSDHLPILVEVPLNEQTNLNIISLNVLGHSGCSGLHAVPNWEDDGAQYKRNEKGEFILDENGNRIVKDEEVRARYQRMIKGLVAGVKLQQADVLFLQEASSHLLVPILEEELNKQLKGQWKIIADERGGIISCYNTERFEQECTYNLALMSDETQLELGKIYLREKEGKIAYSVITPQGETIQDQITEVPAPSSFTIETLKDLRRDLKVFEFASQKGHILTSLLLDQMTHDLHRIRLIQLQDKVTKKMVDLYNIWGKYDPISRRVEKCFENLLQEKTSNSVSVIVGDTNSRIAPLDDRRQNITTGIVPVRFNSENGALPNVQIPDYPDGGFYRDQTGIHQLRIKILDYQSGEVICDNRNIDELQAWLEYRMVMCLDEHFKNTNYINDMTIFEYEKTLRAAFNDESTIVSMAVNSVNDKAIAIGFLPNQKGIYDDICRELKNCAGFQHRFVQKDGEIVPHRCIFVPLDQVDLLHRALMKQVVWRQQIIDDLNRQRKSVSGFHFFRLFLQPSPQKGEALRDLHDKILKMPLDSNKQQCLTTITKWEQQHQEIITTHRNRFFKLKRDNVSTATQLMLGEIKNKLQSP